MRLPEIPLQIPPGILKKYEIRIFGVCFWYFRGIFSIPCRRGNLYVGLVFLAYFGVCGVFCSVVASWVLKIDYQELSGDPNPQYFLRDQYPKDSAALQILRRSKFTMRSKFTIEQ